jgi:predicted phage replisome organizer
MADSKKFYWLKLKRDFFKRHDIRIIEEMPNGKDYVLFYLKLLLESIDHEGSLRFSDTIPYNEQMLSVVTNTNVDIVRSAMKLFIELGMMSICDDQTIYMAEVDKLIGSAVDNDAANRQRRCRERKKQEALPSVTGALQNVTTSVTEDNERKREEIKKDIDTDIEIERENEKAFAHSIENDSLSDLSTEFSTAEENKRKILGGELGKGVVLLSQEQMDDLLDKLSLEEFDYYVGVVADCILKGKKYTKKTHYQAILDMAVKDRRVRTK